LALANTYYQDPLFAEAHPYHRYGPRKDLPDNQTIYVHLIAHTHDDVGWLKNVDEYYTGSNQANQQAEVESIITESVVSLLKNPERKFTYVEMKVFSMWWDRQNNATRESLMQLIQNGQWEFVNAGWSMHDEATPHYEDMINNMMKGHDWLKKNLDIIPRIGWHIDPFGHSQTNPRLFADMGFDAWFFARLSYDDKYYRL
jgi:alpha-mannosidase